MTPRHGKCQGCALDPTGQRREPGARRLPDTCELLPTGPPSKDSRFQSCAQMSREELSDSGKAAERTGGWGCCLQKVGQERKRRGHCGVLPWPQGQETGGKDTAQSQLLSVERCLFRKKSPSTLDPTSLRQTY